MISHETIVTCLDCGNKVLHTTTFWVDEGLPHLGHVHCDPSVTNKQDALEKVRSIETFVMKSMASSVTRNAVMALLNELVADYVIARFEE